MNHTPGVNPLGTFVPDQLIAGDFPVRTRFVTLAKGQNLNRGSVLGKITASGEYTLSKKASTDGSEKPIAILTESADASKAAQQALIYKTGDFSKHHVIFGTGHDYESTVDSLDSVNIYLIDTMKG